MSYYTLQFILLSIKALPLRKSLFYSMSMWSSHIIRHPSSTVCLDPQKNKKVWPDSFPEIWKGGGCSIWWRVSNWGPPSRLCKTVLLALINHSPTEQDRNLYLAYSIGRNADAAYCYFFQHMDHVPHVFTHKQYWPYSGIMLKIVHAVLANLISLIIRSDSFFFFWMSFIY